MNLPHKKALICLFVSLQVFFIGCVDDKDYYDPTYELPNPMEDITVPDDFDWKTSNSINLKVIVDDQFNGQYSYQIDVFDANPLQESEAKKITTGYAKMNSPWITVVSVPAALEGIWVKQTLPNGLSSVTYASTENSDVTVNFGVTNGTRAARAAMTRSDVSDKMTPPEVDPDDRTLFPVSAPEDAIVIVGSARTSPDKNYIINGQTTDVGDGQRISLYVTEDATLNSIKNIAGRKLYILPGKKLTLNFALSFQTANCIISVGEGAQLITGNNGMTLGNNGTAIYNLGTINCGGHIHTMGSSIIYNAGTFLVESIEIDTNSKFYNMNNVEVATNWNGVGGPNSGFYNGGAAEATVNGVFAVSSGNMFVNDGTANFDSYSSVGSSKVENNGDVTVAGLTNVDASNAHWYNNGTWITETMTTKGSGNNFFNGCKLIVNDKLSMSSTVFTNLDRGYVKTTDLDMKDTHISMGSGAFINVTGLATFEDNRNDDSRGSKKEGMYGIGTGDKALFRMNEAVTNDGNNTQAMYYSGNLQVVCDKHFPATNPNNSNNRDQYELANGAQMSKEAENPVEIKPTTCNEGWGTDPNPPGPPVVTPDVDPYTYTYLFEDMWPLYGDYDMNDMVLRVNNITKYKTENNEVSKVSFDISVRAVGAEKRIAAAIMLDEIDASAIKSVSYSAQTPTAFNVAGTGAETNQDKAVIPLFNEAHAFMGKPNAHYINTKPESPQDDVANPPVITVTVEFTSLIDASYLDVKFLNVFIVTMNLQANTSIPVNKSGRREIHLVDFAPTKMAETNIFGNHNDGSEPGSDRYYRSKENFPWGIMLIEDSPSFRWPREHKEIRNAYGEFDEWVTSEGNSNKEWWKNPTSTDLIY